MKWDRCQQIFSCVSGGAVKLCVSLQVPQTIPMDLRIGQRLAKPSPDTALLALKQTQQLQHQFFLASLHQQQVEQLTRPHLRVPMDPPPQDTVPGKQEQELRLLLNKDKSKRSKRFSILSSSLSLLRRLHGCARNFIHPRYLF
ncbi:hypothetical protein E2320_016376 [Naja naja]|nr:hypothetical protein E2320_016376 [Naja naja]